MRARKPQCTQDRNHFCVVSLAMARNEKVDDYWGLQKLSKDDLQSVEPGGWLTDNALMTALCRFSQQHLQAFAKVLIIAPSVVELLKTQITGQLAQLHEQVEQIFFPTNVGNYHWILIRLLRGELGVSFQIYDSLPSPAVPETAIDTVQGVLSNITTSSPAWKAEANVTNVRVPRQPNGNDCGVFVFQQICQLCCGTEWNAPSLSAVRSKMQQLLAPDQVLVFPLYWILLAFFKFLHHCILVAERKTRSSTRNQSVSG